MMIRIQHPTSDLKKAFSQPLLPAAVGFLRRNIEDGSADEWCRDLLIDIVANPPRDLDPKDSRIFYTLDDKGITAYYKVQTQKA
jgi:hypothetical protein